MRLLQGEGDDAFSGEGDGELIAAVFPSFCEWLEGYGIGMVKIVVIIDFCGGEYFSADLFRGYAGEVDGDFRLIVKVCVDKGDRGFSILYGCSGINHGDLSAVAGTYHGGGDIEGEQFGILMRHIHLEKIICRGQHHVFPFSQHHRLKDVCDLSDVGHLHAVSEEVECVETKRGDHRIAHRVLLIEMS